MPSNMCLRSASARSLRASRRETQSKRNLIIYEVKKAERWLRQVERQEDILRERLQALLQEDLQRNRRRLTDLRRAQWILQQELMALLLESAAAAA